MNILSYDCWCNKIIKIDVYCILIMFLIILICCYCNTIERKICVIGPVKKKQFFENEKKTTFNAVNQITS